jgi:hypothetical protein
MCRTNLTETRRRTSPFPTMPTRLSRLPVSGPSTPSSLQQHLTTFKCIPFVSTHRTRVFSVAHSTDFSPATGEIVLVGEVNRSLTHGNRARLATRGSKGSAILFNTGHQGCSVAPNTADFTLPPVAFQRGGAAASRTTEGGVAALASVLTRGSAKGALFLTKSVLISTF